MIPSQENPITKYQYVTVVFGAAGIDLAIEHTLAPELPDLVDYEVVQRDRPCQVYHDETSDRRAWTAGQILLRCDTADARVTLRLTLPTMPQTRTATTTPYDGLTGGASDVAYGSSWDGVTTVAPSKNAVYDKIESFAPRQTFRGLTLRTHPDADVAASKVYLNHADEIVMHDGEHVEDWDDLVADITAAGAGGLDTGAEGASRWYEIHAVRKASDGTKKVLLHRAKSFDLDQSLATGNDASSALRNASGNTKRGQTFQAGLSGPMPFVELYFHKTGTPTNRIWAELYATSAGLPTGAVVATSDKLDVSKVATAAQWVQFIFRTPPTLVSGTTYALVIAGDFTIDVTHHILLDVDSSSPPYANGSIIAWDGASTWTANTAVDMLFRVYVTQNDTAVTMPAGYDQRCLIGWVYNNSSSDFVAFIANGRAVTLSGPAAVIVAGAATIVTLLDASAALPPVPVRLLQTQISGSVTGTIVRLSGVFAGTANLYGGINYTAPSNGAYYWATSAPMEFQRCYYTVGSNTGSIYLFSWEW